MVFHQNGSTLTYWADDNTDWNVSGIISNAINPFWVVTLTFPVVWIWGWLNKRNMEPSTPTKIAIGMFSALPPLAFSILLPVRERLRMLPATCSRSATTGSSIGRWGS